METFALSLKNSRYSSRLDKGLLPVLLFFPTLLIAVGCWFVTDSPLVGIAAMVLALFHIVLTLVFIWPCYYLLGESQLEVRCGLARVVLPYKDIQRVQASNASMPSPALSLRRLAIESHQGLLLISPANRSKFLQELSLRMHGRYVAGAESTADDSVNISNIVNDRI